MPVEGGFYTVSQAAKLLEIQGAQKIYGWLRGYPNSKAQPVIKRQYEPLDEKEELGFLDMMEARFIKYFRDQGVTMNAIRVAAENARKEIRHPHPFATSMKFISDRKRIFALSQEQTGDKKLLDLTSRNFAMYDVIETTLHKGVEYDPNTATAIKWYPRCSDYPEIVIDPRRAYGQPIIEKEGVPTETLYRAWRAEDGGDGSYARVADAYEVDEKMVRKAVEFEVSLAA